MSPRADPFRRLKPDIKPVFQLNQYKMVANETPFNPNLMFEEMNFIYEESKDFDTISMLESPSPRNQLHEPDVISPYIPTRPSPRYMMNLQDDMKISISTVASPTHRKPVVLVKPAGANTSTLVSVPVSKKKTIFTRDPMLNATL
jgi:hypothetical protein